MLKIMDSKVFSYTKTIISCSNIWDDADIPSMLVHKLSVLN